MGYPIKDLEDSGLSELLAYFIYFAAVILGTAVLGLIYGSEGIMLVSSVTGGIVGYHRDIMTWRHGVVTLLLVLLVSPIKYVLYGKFAWLEFTFSSGWWSCMFALAFGMLRLIRWDMDRHRKMTSSK